MQTGRPSKYEERYCDEMVEFCKGGLSLTSFAAEIGVCRDTLSEWASKHPDFSASVKRAKAQCAAFWERKAILGVTGDKDVNPTLCIFGLKNMAPDDWAETVKNELSGEITNRVVREFVNSPHPNG